MKNEINAFKKLIENQTAFNYFKHSVNIYTDCKIETREDLAKFASENYTGNQINNIIIEYLEVNQITRHSQEKKFLAKIIESKKFYKIGEQLFRRIADRERFHNRVLKELSN
jgi:hypothetical protein